MVAVAFVNHSLLVITPDTVDAALQRLDCGSSTGFYRWTDANPFPRFLLRSVYYGLPIFTAFVLITSPRRMSCARTWLIAGLCAPPFYVAFPAVGPAHIGDPYAPRNCVPSLHMTWALLCALYIAPRFRPVAIVFAVMTALATLGTGEHYLIDLIVALPFTAAICWVNSAVPWNAISQRVSAPESRSRMEPDGIAEIDAE